MATQHIEKKEYLSDDAGAKKTRRTGGVLKGDRQERVVESVLRATAEVLSRSGYAGFRVDDVAAASGVNKTTIYRRWPGKAELVAAALDAVRLRKEVPETGDLRTDLIALMREIVRFAATPTGRGLMRILQVERADPEVERMARALRNRQRGLRREMIERAMARGELPRTVDPSLVSELVFGPLYARVVSSFEGVDDHYLNEVVDTVLAGVRARGAV